MNTSLTGRVEGSGSSGLPNSILLSIAAPLPPSTHFTALPIRGKRLGGS